MASVDKIKTSDVLSPGLVGPTYTWVLLVLQVALARGDFDDTRGLLLLQQLADEESQVGKMNSQLRLRYYRQTMPPTALS